MSYTVNFEDMASELLANIFLNCSSITDAHSLASTCHRLRDIFKSRRLPILAHAVEEQYGPLQDAIQLVTHNESQPAHIIRAVPLSVPLIQQVVSVGRIATKWEEIYPFKKWKENYEERRILSDRERYVLRRAIYRLWLFDSAFHNAEHPRHLRMTRAFVLNRAALLHNWRPWELAEVADLHMVLRETIRSNVCPDNGTIQRKFRKRFPGSNHQLLFNMHLNYPPPLQYQSEQAQMNAANYKYYAKYKPTPTYEPGCEGWGDEISHYYVVEDMMKLDPGAILWLKENAPAKWQVESYVKQLGSWFDNNGDTFGHTMEQVLADRGIDVGEFIDAVRDGDAGVAKRDL